MKVSPKTVTVFTLDNLSSEELLEIRDGLSRLIQHRSVREIVSRYDPISVQRTATMVIQINEALELGEYGEERGEEKAPVHKVSREEEEEGDDFYDE